ncbi:adenylate/guanylate cyclase domain-containing protein [Leptospira gomenensis]|uniref:Adenylate/guanylate cyclase domain-containing protein n=3 Tax=Leptospira gomenensis TaxID=2484974 RepID=A0A5F1Y9C2_9LEPT|nr:adenylate/guanylate cyclase domain-containing protein [Leptospira gomenensis]TGK32395.1 adenylate/guanylate cyclase domain-containing protein [Leptospira gomenensis]TGK44010.1 adenylate/guanylate cyclase domain-containing protein [Leptospira gomenensis]TGK48962.1 adenylate/guanylate cyclase domain-containing protein [Leptospira gomenensis]TGK54685.1 adenylate/guanylate cyclase domain-containing protein [Leptospira gomenensis]
MLSIDRTAEREKLHVDGLLNFSAGFTIAGLLWSALYFFLGFPQAALIPGGYAVLSLSSLIFVFATGRYSEFRVLQFVFILILPVILQLSLGGFENSGAVIIWSILCPLGALAFAPTRYGLVWFGLFIAALLSAGLAEFFEFIPNIEVKHNIRILFFVINISGAGTLTFLSLFYFIFKSKQEHDRAENLLLNILPEPIAERLKRNPSTIADGYPMVSILFADIENFTGISQKIAPEILVHFLNDVFSHFDFLAEKYGMEKIKTIGDAYMAVAGIPIWHENHAENAMRMALEMQTFVKNIRDPTGTPLKIRIGIHSGPVVAGVIGRRKFAYDLWGDAVNTASRLESHGLPGRIQISESTYDLLTDKSPLEISRSVDVKGKGVMKTYLSYEQTDIL